MKVSVYGGLGMQGRVVTETLVAEGALVEVTVLDQQPGTNLPAGIRGYIPTDLSSYEAVKAHMAESDLVVCTLPSTLGYNVVKAAVEVGVNAVDLSFTSEDLSVFDQEAKDKGISIIVDAGVAPGLSNLIAGRAMLQNPNEIGIIVGGIAQSQQEPYGYTISWSLDDLLEEYTRPARILVNGEEQVVPALTGKELVRLQEGNFRSTDAAWEAVYTDGLRSLLQNNGGVPNLYEKTLRWPGHYTQIEGLLKAGEGYFKQTLLRECNHGAPDMLIMVVRADSKTVTLVAKSDENMSAMAKTTALSCATFASLLANNMVTTKGVLPPEKLASDDAVYQYVLEKMDSYGVTFMPKYPFMT